MAVARAGEGMGDLVEDRVADLGREARLQIFLRAIGPIGALGPAGDADRPRPQVQEPMRQVAQMHDRQARSRQEGQREMGRHKAQVIRVLFGRKVKGQRPGRRPDAWQLGLDIAEAAGMDEGRAPDLVEVIGVHPQHQLAPDATPVRTQEDPVARGIMGHTRQGVDRTWGSSSVIWPVLR